MPLNVRGSVLQHNCHANTLRAVKYANASACHFASEHLQGLWPSGNITFHQHPLSQPLMIIPTSSQHTNSIMHNLFALSTFLLATSHFGAAVTPGRLGLCLGNQHPNGSLKSAADFLLDLNAIRTLTPRVTLVRTYGAGGTGNPTAQGILQAAKTAGFQVLLGAWYFQTASLCSLRCKRIC